MDNENKDNLILGEGSTQRLYDINSTGEVKHPTNFT